MHQTDHNTSFFLKTAFQKFYLVNSWISWPKYVYFNVKVKIRKNAAPTVSLVMIYICFLVISWTYESDKDTTPIYMYLWCSVSYVGAMLASNLSLRYVNYPTQVVLIRD